MKAVVFRSSDFYTKICLKALVDTEHFYNELKKK